MATQIYYNNINPFDKISNVPLVSKEETPIRYHDRWATLTTITLNGVITGSCGLGFNGIVERQKQLISGFAQDYKNLIIYDNGINVYEAPYCAVKSINFEDSKYTKIIPYTITLESYESGFFSGVYGVINPSLSLEYNENDDGTLTINKRVSAQGFTTTNQAIINARNWVQTRTGWNPTYFPNALPYFINYNGVKAPCLKKQEERVDRFNGIYSVEEEYHLNPLGSNNAILKYSVDINYDDEPGIYTVTIQGTVEGCPNASMATVRSLYNTVNLYNLANTSFKKAYPSAPNLNPDYLSYDIKEDNSAKIIEFTQTLDTETIPTVVFDYTITSDINLIEDIYTISIEGVIRGRGSLKTRWERVVNYVNNNLNLFNLANNFYTSQKYPYTLVNTPVDYNVQINSTAGEISISCTYNDRPLPPPGYDKFDFTLEVTPRIAQKLSIPALLGKYVIQDLASPKRAQVSLVGSAYSVNSNLENDIKNRMGAIINQYIPDRPEKVLKDKKVSITTAPQGVNYNFLQVESYEEKQDFEI